MLRATTPIVLVLSLVIPIRAGEMDFESPIANAAFAWDSAVSGSGEAGLDIGTAWEFRITQTYSGLTRTAAVSGSVVAGTSENRWSGTSPIPPAGPANFRWMTSPRC